MIDFLKNLIAGSREYHFASIGRDGVCISVWTFPCQIDQADIVPIDALDPFLIGKAWTGQEWVRASFPSGIKEWQASSSR